MKNRVAVTIAGEDGLRLSDFFVTGQTVCEALHDLSVEQASMDEVVLSLYKQYKI